jgi:hypothetical protein
MKSKEFQIFRKYLLSKFCYMFPPLFSGIYFLNQILIFFCNLQLLCGIRFSNSRYIYMLYSYSEGSSTHTEWQYIECLLQSTKNILLLKNSSADTAGGTWTQKNSVQRCEVSVFLIHDLMYMNYVDYVTPCSLVGRYWFVRESCLRTQSIFFKIL